MIEYVGELSEIAEAEANSPLAKLSEGTESPSSDELSDLIDKAESSDSMMSTENAGEVIPDAVDDDSVAEDVDDASSGIEADETDEQPEIQQEDVSSENTEGAAEANEIKKTGGSYGELKREGWGWSSEPPREIHHMPSDASSPLERNDGPSIVMEYDDHKETASCGSSRDAQEYRAEQKRLIEDGKFREALQMDIDDIHDKFGDKYDGSIEQMLDYVDDLEKNNQI